MAEIDEPVIIRERKNGLCYKRTLPKYDLISSHRARRSFATNAYLSGIPSISIMQITGHSTERAFLQYIKVSQEENAINLASHSFFK
jgi:integrase